jgi:cell division septal protein FtsQ
VKLAMANYTAGGEEEIKRRELLIRQREQQERERARTLFRRRLAASTRKLSALCVGLVLVVLVLTYLTEIQSFFTQKADWVVNQVQIKAKASPFRELAVGYEEQVNNASK